jgi:hypothetical protein
MTSRTAAFVAFAIGDERQRDFLKGHSRDRTGLSGATTRAWSDASIAGFVDPGSTRA